MFLKIVILPLHERLRFTGKDTFAMEHSTASSPSAPSNGARDVEGKQP